MANIFKPEWNASQQRDPFVWKRAKIGRQTGAEKLGASLFELPPGASTFPLHIHHANEEMIVLLEGRLTLRRVDGEEELKAGDVIACPAGQKGAHRLDNRSGESASVLIVSTMVAPEINEFPESGKMWVRDHAPGADQADGGLDALVIRDEAQDYLDGEK